VLRTVENKLATLAKKRLEGVLRTVEGSLYKYSSQGVLRTVEGSLHALAKKKIRRCASHC
jgi:hypothetical protein